MIEPNLSEQLPSVLQRALFTEPTKFQETSEKNVTDGLYEIAKSIHCLANALDRFGKCYLNRL